MRLTLALCFLIGLADPALACHRYRSWSYPWPQSCRTSSPAPVQRRRTWFVEVAPEPVKAEVVADPEAGARAAAIDQLRMELRERAVSVLELNTTGLTRVEEPK